MHSGTRTYKEHVIAKLEENWLKSISAFKPSQLRSFYIETQATVTNNVLVSSVKYSSLFRPTKPYESNLNESKTSTVLLM